MRLLLWFAACLSVVNLVRSDLEFKLNISKPFGELFDNLFKLPPLFDLPKKNPSTENPLTESTSTNNPPKQNPPKQNPPKVNPTNKPSFHDISPSDFTIFTRHYFYENENLMSTVLSNIHRIINDQKPDEVKLLEILLACPPSKLIQLQIDYQRRYHNNLIQSLKNILTGELEEAVISWMIPRENYYAREIYSALNEIGPDERALIDTLCIFNHSAINKIDSTYFKLYHRYMRNDLNAMTSGPFGDLLSSLIQLRPTLTLKSINPWEVVDSEDYFFKVMSEHSFPEIFQYAMDYHKQSGKYLENSIMEKYFGDLQRALLSIVYYAKGEKVFFGRRLHESLEGDMVDHHSLIRLAIMDKKVDYNEILDFYKKHYKKDLDEVMTTKIASKNFRKFIQVLFKRKQQVSNSDVPSLVW